MNLCYVTTHVHWAEHGRVAERERIVLSARRSCSDQRHRGNRGDRVAFALKELTADVEARIAALVKKAER
jgi:hypothetical protein